MLVTNEMKDVKARVERRHYFLVFLMEIQTLRIEKTSFHQFSREAVRPLELNKSLSVWLSICLISPFPFCPFLPFPRTTLRLVHHFISQLSLKPTYIDFL